jgi:hypothetical protein
MKRIVIFPFVLLFFSFLIQCKNKPSTQKVTNPDYVDGNATVHNIPPEDTLQWTEIQWIDTLKDLGTIKKGGLVEINFRYKNIGKKPLSINSVVAGCGCTQPEKPVKLTQPGETDVVKAKFNTENQNGPVQKHITVTCNTKKSSYLLDFKANVTAN